ncbi:hypothetical protein [Streptomyces tendae]|uniref:hypothetical protein n=1 Tax=Streptomyces tendae TaxID=1932 RepID=UPI00371C459B
MTSPRVLVVGREPQVVGAVVGAVVEAVGRHTVATGATRDADALAELAGGGVTLLVVGGGVEGRSRELLRAGAQAHGVPVVESPLRGEEVESYVRREVLPRLTAHGTGGPAR